MWLAPMLLACGGSLEPLPPAPTAAKSEDHAPWPFTAEQIRDAMPVGTKLVYRMTPGGKDPYDEHWEVTAATPETGTIAARLVKPETGELLEDQGAGTSTWTELRDHATFLKRATTITEATVTVPAGTYRTRRYTIRADDGSVRVYDFAPALPGPPVSLVVTKGEATTWQMSLVRRTSP